MCKIGDIILISKFIGDDKNKISPHYFVVINDELGTIEGLDFDIVGTVMSSFKDDKHRLRKMKYKENLEVHESDGIISKHNLKSGYIKSDQLYYFNKNKTKYIVVGKVEEEILIKLLQLIQYLDKKGKLKQNIENIKNTTTN